MSVSVPETGLSHELTPTLTLVLNPGQRVYPLLCSHLKSFCPIASCRVPRGDSLLAEVWGSPQISPPQPALILDSEEISALSISDVIQVLVVSASVAAVVIGIFAIIQGQIQA